MCASISMALNSSFFVQAEDGIRAGRVTGVQTCALPISGEVVDRDLLPQPRGLRVGQGRALAVPALRGPPAGLEPDVVRRPPVVPEFLQVAGIASGSSCGVGLPPGSLRSCRPCHDEPSLACANRGIQVANPTRWVRVKELARVCSEISRGRL